LLRMASTSTGVAGFGGMPGAGAAAGLGAAGDGAPGAACGDEAGAAGAADACPKIVDRMLPSMLMSFLLDATCPVATAGIGEERTNSPLARTSCKPMTRKRARALRWCPPLMLERNGALAFWWSMIFSENRYPLFGIML
jgi:hypothetical protein